ncbi:MAG: NAD(P)H-binding protein [Breznakibacter sp.]
MDAYGKTALVMGATGLVGMHVLDLLVASDQYQTIHVAGRNAPQQQSPKIVFHRIALADVALLPVARIDDVFCALGTTIAKAGSQDAFRVVDYDAVVGLAEWARQKGARHFAVVSSIGANAQSKKFYLRTKGQMEQRLGQLGPGTLIIVRPSLLLGQRNEFRFAEKLGEYCFKVLGPLMVGKLKKFRPIKAEKVANAMVMLSESRSGDIYIEESNDLQRF